MRSSSSLTRSAAASSLPGVQAAPAEPDPADLLEHCGTEMNHLAGFLPGLYAEFG